MNNSFFRIQPSDLSYSQLYVSPAKTEATPAVSLNPSPSMLFLVVWCMLACGMIWYRKHRTHHHKIERQRALLERMWQLSSTK